MLKKSKKNIDKIIITGQMLRGDCFSCEWIYRLFKYALEEVTGLPIYCTTIPISSNANKNDFIQVKIDEIYKNYEISFKYTNKDDYFWSTNWAKLYYNTEYNEKAYEYIYSIFKNALVISYEVEDLMSAIFDYYNIPQIEINLDPIRFLEDIMLCFKTKNKKVYQQLLKYRVDEEYLYLSANYLKTSQIFSGSRHYTNERNVLFLGQTSCDKTLVDKKNGQIYSILNHKDEFKKAISGFDNILYKRHPLARNDEEILEYIKSLGNVKIIDDNFYKLLSRDDIAKVVSISSGTCSEAKYFGKDVQILLKEGVPRQTENKFNSEKYISIYQDFFSLNFWSEVLSPLVKTKKYKKELTIAGAKNKLRNSRTGYSVYYAYEDFDHIAGSKLVENKLKDKIIKSFMLQDILREDIEDDD